MRARGLQRVILVTSKQHTRRVRVTWGSLASKELVATVRYAREDPFDPDRWWATSTGVLRVLREIGGLVNLWIGAPLRPQET